MDGPALECEVCGGTDFCKESGYFYCNECQTQSQQIQEHVFERVEHKNATTKKIHKKKEDKRDIQLTSWECYNIVLKGLTGELLALGADPQLKIVVRLLWMKYLHKCEVFNLKSNRMPKVSALGSKKDIAILYNRKKRKRSSSRASSATSSVITTRFRSAKKKALVQSHCDQQLSQSQSLTQDSLLANSLSSLKSESETPENVKIQYNKLSTKELNRLMSKKHRNEHQRDIDGELKCHKLQFKSFSMNFRTGPSNLTSHTLYNILYIGLLILQDSIQLGDLLRFIREGHVSFECFRHFFDESIPDKAINLPHKNQKLLSNLVFRKRTAELVRFLEVSDYIVMPDLTMLCSRYCTELNLPDAIIDCTVKLMSKTEPKMPFKGRSKAIPNYEGRVMSMIFVTLKLLFGLDGVTEINLSKYADILTNSGVGVQMFNFFNWMQFIADRKLIIKKYHLPTALREDGRCDSETYLKYLKNQGFKYSGSKRSIHKEVRDYLQVLEDVLEAEDDEGGDDVKFEPSLTPFVTYTTQLLNSELLTHSLDANFLHDSLDFLLRPCKYLEFLGTHKVRHGGANEDIVIQDPMYLHNATVYLASKSKQPVCVRIVDNMKEDKNVKEFLDSQKKATLTNTDLTVVLSNWQNSQQKQFARNKVLLQKASANVEIPSNAKPSQKYVEHFNPFERYWMNVPINTATYYLSKQDMNEIFDKFPNSFKLLLKEGCRIIEQDINDLFMEFSLSEIYIVYCTDFSSSKKNGSKKPLIEFKDFVRTCKSVW